MNPERRAMLQMLLVGILWSFGGILIKLLPWNSLVIAGARSAIAAVVMYAYMRLKKLRLTVTRRTLAIGFVTFMVFSLLLTAYKLTTAANAIVLQYTAPIYVLVFSVVFRKEKARRGDILAVVLTIVGIALFFMDQLGTGSALGNILALTSGVFFALMFFISGNSSEDARMSGLVLGHVMTAVMGAAFAFAYPPEVTGTSLLLVLLLGVGQIGIPYTIYSVAVKRCPPLTCSIISVIEPLLNPLWVFLAVGERPSYWALIGAAVVLATVTIWCVWGERQKQQAVSDAMNNE